MLWGVRAAPASSPDGVTGLYLLNKPFVGAFLWCSLLSACCPPFQGTRGSQQQKGCRGGAEGRAGGSGGGTGRAAAGCLIRSKRKYLLLPLSNVFAPDVFEHLLWTGVQETSQANRGVREQHRKRLEEPFGIGRPRTLRGQQVCVQGCGYPVSSGKSPHCPLVPSLCQKPLNWHTQTWAQQDFIPCVPGYSEDPIRLTAPATPEQPRVLPEQPGKEEQPPRH